MKPSMLSALLALTLLVPASWAGCFERCDLSCIWSDYLAYAREAADDYARAAHYDGSAADGYQQALDAAQGELESMLPSIQGVLEEGILGEACSKVKAQMERLERAMNAIAGIQGAGVLERMAQIARRNGDYNWALARKALTRYRWCCKNRPPAPPPQDVAPPPAPPPPPPSQPPVITTSGEAKPHPPLGHGQLDEIERARKDFEAGRSSSDLAGSRHPRVLLWRTLAVGRKHAGAARSSKLSHLRQHPDPTLREAVEAEITRTR